MADLKPCPFCGGDAGCNRRSGDERDGYADLVTIFCTGCGVRVAASGDTSKGGYADNSTVYERAIAAWNRRAASSAAQQAEKTVAAIDSALRGKVNDPEPLPKLHAHSVAGEPTTYGLVAGLLRERDALLAKVAKFDQRIVDLGVLAMETAAPAPASPAALTGIPCKAFEAAFPAAADCRNKDGYHGIMAVRMEGFAAGVEAAARALPDDRISAIYYKTVQAQRKPDAGPFHIAFARALLAASPADQVGWQPIETAPNNVPVLVAAELPVHAPGDWHIKVGALQQGHWRVWGAAWIPTHWMPLPAAPQPREWDASATPPAAE